MAIAERRKRERTARRKSILDAAERIIVDRGYPAMTMADVAKAAELSKGTIYLYFASRAALAAAVATRMLDRFLPVLRASLAETKTGLEAVRQLLQTYSDFSRTNPHHFRFALSWLSAAEQIDDETEAFRVYKTRVGAVLAEAVAAIERGQADGSIRGDVQALPQALQLWTSMLGIVLVDLNRESMASRLPMPADLSQLVSLHLDTLVRGLAAGTQP